MAKRKSGLEDVPQFLTRPLWKDSMVWWAIAVALFWAAVLWWLVF